MRCDRIKSLGEVPGRGLISQKRIYWKTITNTTHVNGKDELNVLYVIYKNSRIQYGPKQDPLHFFCVIKDGTFTKRKRPPCQLIVPFTVSLLMIPFFNRTFLFHTNHSMLNFISSVSSGINLSFLYCIHSLYTPIDFFI